MPYIYRYTCNKCQFALPSGWGGRFYIIDDKGERIIPGHPNEINDVFNIVGEENISEDNMEEIFKARTGFSNNCVCLTCLHQFDLDIKRDENICPNCNSLEIKTVTDMVEKRCPSCKKGLIEAEIIGVT